MRMTGTYLADRDAAFPSQFLLGLLARIRIRQVRIKVLVQYLRGLLAEVASLAPGVQEPRPQYHHRLARRLLQLHLDGAELLVDDLDHAFDLLGRDGAGARLLAQQVHHVRGELVARLLVLLQLLVVDLADLAELGAVVGVLDGVVRLAALRRR